MSAEFERVATPQTQQHFAAMFASFGKPTAVIFPAWMARASAMESFASTVRMVPLINMMSAFVGDGAAAIWVRQEMERLSVRTAGDKNALRGGAILIKGTPVVIN